VTILALGRGIDPNGEFNSTGRLRVTLTLDAARTLQKRGLDVQVIWTGNWSGAMLAFAKEQSKIDGITQLAETDSTSAVGSMARSVALTHGSLIIPIADVLDFKCGRVQFATRLAFPLYDTTFLELPCRFGWKQLLTQAACALVTRLGMAGVRQGNEHAILERQAWLEQRLSWLIGR
jgi:hypothetical protein